MVDIEEDTEHDFGYGKICWLCDVYAPADNLTVLLLCIPGDPRGFDQERLPEVINGCYFLHESKDGSFSIPAIGKRAQIPVVHLGQIYYKGNFEKTIHLFEKGVRATSTECKCCQHVKYHNGIPPKG